MAELADAHGSGPCGSNTMRVQVSFPALGIDMIHKCPSLTGKPNNGGHLRTHTSFVMSCVISSNFMIFHYKMVQNKAQNMWEVNNIRKEYKMDFVKELSGLEEDEIYDILSFVKSLGLSPEDPLHEAHAIGGYTGESPLSMAAAYSAFGNGGYYTKPYSYTKLEYMADKKEFLDNCFADRFHFIFTNLAERFGIAIRCR